MKFKTPTVLFQNACATKNVKKSKRGGKHIFYYLIYECMYERMNLKIKI